MQGKLLIIFRLINDFIAELVSTDNYIKSNLDFLGVKTSNPELILSSFQKKVPKVYSYLGDTIQKIMSPCIILSEKIENNFTDYSFMVFPALKGLEGYIKKLFADKGVIIPRTGFYGFIKNGKVAAEYQEKINCEKTCQAINQCYSIYKNHRHSIFHVDGVIGNTRIIDDINKAKELIFNVLDTIESSYKNIIG